MSGATCILTLKLGGSILAPTDLPDASRFRAYAKEVAAFVRETGAKLFIIVGGGKPARGFISCARLLGATETEADEIGIAITRVNAYLMSLALASEGLRVPPSIPESARDACQLMSTGAYDCVVTGGFSPGQSTTACAALVAERAKVRTLLIGTNVPGVFTSDPRKDPHARKLEYLSYDELRAVISHTSMAGSYELIDDVALGIVERSRIVLVIFDARNPQNVRRALLAAVRGDFRLVTEIGSVVRSQA